MIHQIVTPPPCKIFTGCTSVTCPTIRVCDNLGSKPQTRLSFRFHLPRRSFTCGHGIDATATVRRTHRMALVDVKESALLSICEAEHWYYRAKLRALRSAISGGALPTGTVIYDIGAGSGFFSLSLLEDPRFCHAVLIDTAYTADDLGQTEHAGKTYWRCSDLPEAEDHCPAAAPALCLLMDVLEHVDDDRALLSQVASAVPEGSYFLITVPAYNFLWSSHDVFLGHKRRYTLSAVSALTTDCGLTMVSSFYYFALVFPLAALLRLGQRLKTKLGCHVPARDQLRAHSATTNFVLESICKAEIPFMKLNRLFGLSCFVLARKDSGLRRD